MDTLDVKILKLLQQNARVTVSEIASQINLSVPAVSDRLKKLEAGGIIDKYVAIVNPARFQKELTAIMFISLERPKFTEQFVEFVQREDEILECHYLAGDYDYALKIITRSAATLERLLNRIKSVPGVQKTRTIVALSTVKNNHSIIPEDYSGE
ncbi:Lrp/AsnC family leucine-responsive transcriptional regulator [Hydrogenispora ethanolica]|uniref:Lrp/AsnC family leucine-responsive transcriptional regulator n=1 Tax=Hydrogenispora ethanolica TaxID=1082276 RepID=A0A4R1S556_HYDET|nr:Lrp/AsnC family transcriptional regulator [Hydrogenispora ethanolica]TCL74144.1 Lrp/AsnC family leucine-responsive transcriptional regulator [Hydrogenispora ethanolica]